MRHTMFFFWHSVYQSYPFLFSTEWKLTKNRNSSNSAQNSPPTPVPHTPDFSCWCLLTWLDYTPVCKCHSWKAILPQLNKSLQLVSSMLYVPCQQACCHWLGFSIQLHRLAKNRNSFLNGAGHQFNFISFPIVIFSYFPIEILKHI